MLHVVASKPVDVDVEVTVNGVKIPINNLPPKTVFYPYGLWDKGEEQPKSGGYGTWHKKSKEPKSGGYGTWHKKSKESKSGRYGWVSPVSWS